MPSVWDHDLWAQIYGVQDRETREALANLYRLVLDLREGDVLAQKVADRIRARDSLALSRGQKLFAIAVSCVVIIDTVLRIRAALGK